MNAHGVVAHPRPLVAEQSLQSGTDAIRIPRQHDVPAIAFIVAVMVIDAHLVNALLVQGPTSLLIKIGACGASIAAAGYAAYVFKRSGPAARGALALAIGVAAGVEGAGVALAHAVKAAAAGPDVTGIPSFVSAAGLTAFGLVTLVRCAGGWARITVVSIAIVAFVYAVLPVTLAVVFTHSNPGALSGRTPAEAGLSDRDVLVQTSDGVQLAGWYTPSKTAPPS